MGLKTSLKKHLAKIKYPLKTYKPIENIIQFRLLKDPTNLVPTLFFQMKCSIGDVSGGENCI